MVVLFFLFSLSLPAQDNNRHDEPISDEHYKILDTRASLIKLEAASGKNEWSGTYLNGDHHPTVFMWSGTHGFLTWGSHHTFAPSRINFGKAEFLNGRLLVKPEIARDHLNFQYVPAEMVAVKWGQQHFLIAPDRLLNFAYAVHSRAESQIGIYFVKSEDTQKDRSGLPDLPKEYLGILTMKAIQVRITSVKNYVPGESNSDAEITLDLGSNAKIVERMIFYFLNSRGGLRLEVVEVEERRSRARLAGAYLTQDEEVGPKIGMKFTSIIPKKFPDIE